ncbi:MAG: methyltransferase family protein [Egibacteraceae bacterium]
MCVAYDYGLWGMVAFNAVLFLAFLGSFLRLTSRREWQSFGAVAAFVVALFTEMYGFPLTIYLLSAALGRAPFANPFAHASGNLWVSLIGLGSGWATFFMAAGGVVILAGMVLLARGWRLIHVAGGELVTTGPYTFVRHPQYLGLLVVIAGALVQWPTLATVVMAPILATTYLRLARREEAEMRRRFGERWQRYEAATPKLVPRWRDLTGRWQAGVGVPSSDARGSSAPARPRRGGHAGGPSSGTRPSGGWDDHPAGPGLEEPERSHRCRGSSSRAR